MLYFYLNYVIFHPVKNFIEVYGTKWLEPNELFHELNIEALPVYYAAGPFFTEFLTKGELKVKISCYKYKCSVCCSNSNIWILHSK